VLGMVEGLRHGREDLEAQGLPEVNSGTVGLHDCVELNAVVARSAGPVHDVPSQCPPNPASLVPRIDHEAARRPARIDAAVTDFWLEMSCSKHCLSTVDTQYLARAPGGIL